MKEYTGINIQWPISELILSKKKVVETRTYKIPDKYLGVHLAMIETPGKHGKFKARTVAIIKFTKCFKYKNKEEFYLDKERHLVTPESPWAWGSKAKWGWEISIIKKIKEPIPCKVKGIVYRMNINININ